MKSNKGITLTSLLIYVIGLVIILTIVSTLTGYFTKNVNDITVKNITEEQHTRFIAYVTKDVNSDNVSYIKTQSTNKDYFIIYFEDGTEHQYVLSNGIIYYIALENDTVTKKIAICNKVTSVSENVFTYENNTLNYSFKIDDKEFSGSFNINLD